MYQYFVNKEDLFFAAACKWFEHFLACLAAAVEQGDNGFNKIRLFARAFYLFHKEYPHTFKLLFAGSIPVSGEIPHQQKMTRLKREAMQKLAGIIREGKEDGSIRPDLDEKMSAHSLIFIFSGFFYMFSSSGKDFARKYALDEELFILSSLEMVCAALKAN